MTPNLGAGGNAAIESAAALVNAIIAMVHEAQDNQPTESQVKECLTSYQRSRQKRAAAVIKASNESTRLQALKGIFRRVFVNYGLPHLGDFLLDLLCETYIGATMLDYLPPPKRSLSGTMPFNPDQGECKQESKLRRAFQALPFLALFYVAAIFLNPARSIPWVTQLLQAGKVTWETGSTPIRSTFYNIKWLDHM
jgi:hypothetical protein